MMNALVSEDALALLLGKVDPQLFTIYPDTLAGTVNDILKEKRFGIEFAKTPARFRVLQGRRTEMAFAGRKADPARHTKRVDGVADQIGIESAQLTL